MVWLRKVAGQTTPIGSIILVFLLPTGTGILFLKFASYSFQRMVNAYYISDELGHQLLEEHTEATEFVEEEQALESTNMSSRSSNNNKSWIIQIVEVFSDERGSIRQILKVLSAFTFFGCIVGSLMPKNDNLTTTWYPFISSSIGYTYFLMWSVSFYPQVVLNYTRGSTIGLSQDFCLLNLIGCACYMIYNCAFFYSKTIQDQYHDKHNIFS